jgi:hypothetical protein
MEHARYLHGCALSVQTWARSVQRSAGFTFTDNSFALLDGAEHSLCDNVNKSDLIVISHHHSYPKRDLFIRHDVHATSPTHCCDSTHGKIKPDTDNNEQTPDISSMYSGK